MKIEGRPSVGMTFVFTIDEQEAKALDALAGYGADAFIKAFYDSLGKSYMEAHEQGLRRFLTTVREQIPQHLSNLDKAREAVAPRKP